MVRLAKRDFGNIEEHMVQNICHKALPTLSCSLHLFSTQWPEWSWDINQITSSLLRILGHTTLDLKPDPNSGPQCPETSQTPLAISSHFLPLFSAPTLLQPHWILAAAETGQECSQLTDFVYLGLLLREYLPDTCVDNPFLLSKSLPYASC